MAAGAFLAGAFLAGAFFSAVTVDSAAAFLAARVAAAFLVAASRLAAVYCRRGLPGRRRLGPRSAGWRSGWPAFPVTVRRATVHALLHSSRRPGRPARPTSDSTSSARFSALSERFAVTVRASSTDALAATGQLGVGRRRPERSDRSPASATRRSGPWSASGRVLNCSGRVMTNSRTSSALSLACLVRSEPLALQVGEPLVRLLLGLGQRALEGVGQRVGQAGDARTARRSPTPGPTSWPGRGFACEACVLLLG